MAQNTIIGIGVAVVAVLALIRFGPMIVAKTKTDIQNMKATNAAAPAAAVSTPGTDTLAVILRKIKLDVELSAPSRMTVCSLISTIAAVAENLPNLEEKKQARDECKSLGAKFIVTPTPAAPASDSAPADELVPKV